MSQVGLVGLAVMGQNLALNIAEKGFSIAVHNRSPSKVDDTVERAKKEGLGDKLSGYKDMAEFIGALAKPRTVIILVKAGAPVDGTIDALSQHLEAGDLIIDGGNEWFPNTERRAKAVAEKGLHYMGMGVSGGEEGARYGPSLMPGGPKEAYDRVEEILLKVAAQVPDSGPCVTHIGPGASGNYVKMVHNGIEYGDMQLIAETYDILKTLGGFTNDELAKVFDDWNQGELKSFLIEITAQIFKKKDDQEGKDGYLVDAIMDQSGSKGTGKWTCQEAAERGIAASTMSAALDGRYISSFKEDRVAASKILNGPTDTPKVDRDALLEDVRQALYCSKICSYAQGMNLIREAGREFDWALNLGQIARIWKGGCIIRAVFLDRITKAYTRQPDLASLLVDPEFAAEVNERQTAWRRVVSQAMLAGVAVPAMAGSLNYFDAYRRARLPANLIQAQRDFFGAHTYKRVDMDGVFHSQWAQE